MKIIFAGTTRFGIPTLEKIQASEHQLVAVVTQPDRPVGRKQEISKTPIKLWAERQNVPVVAPEKIQDAFSQISLHHPDLMIVAAYGQIIPNTVLDVPRLKSYNLHGSLLPKYRGASPIQTAIIEDEAETGVTVIRMDEKMDHGPIAGTIKVPIAPEDSFDSLYDKLAEAGSKLMLELLPGIEQGNLKLTEQRHAEATFTKLITRPDCRANWTLDAYRLARMAKAYNPEPGLWTTLDQKMVKILEASAVTENKIELPGKIIRHPKGLAVKCGTNLLILDTVQPEGKKPMPGRDYLNGLKNLESKIFV